MQSYTSDHAPSTQHSALTWALIPTKRLAQAKSRLAPALEPLRRRALVLAMLRDVLRALLAAPDLAGVAVISGEPAVLALAAEGGALPLRDTGDTLNDALHQGAAQLAARGASELLVVPGDVPLISAGDIAAMLGALRGGAQLALAPARDGDGTNALALRLPSPLRFQFGPGSCARHLAQAQHLELAIHTYRSPTLGLDIDTIDDLCALDIDMVDDLCALDMAAGARHTQALLQEVCCVVPGPATL
jgi:2-phospho-L-lactate guanylyltransferase